MVYISVIITAHNRKKYLMDAVNSVINQTLPREYYEIIIVKNFDDYTKELEEKGAKVIISDNVEQGKDILVALKETKGDIISFLDDDDLFLPRKLEKVAKVFKRNNVIFYENGYLKFKDENFTFRISEIVNQERIISPRLLTLKALKKLVATYNPFGNSSRMTIRKEELLEYENYLPKIITGIDAFFFTIALISGKDIVLDKDILSLYRIHSMNYSKFSSGDFEYWKKMEVKKIPDFIKSYEVLKEIAEEKLSDNNSYIKAIYDYINVLISYRKILLHLLTQDQKASFKDLINLLKVYPLRKLKYIPLYVMGYAPYRIREYVLKKWYEISIEKSNTL